MKVFILFAHPAYQRSKVNRSLVRAVSNIDQVCFRDLYQLYPEFTIDVQREQELLAKHDVIILQHPFFWYSTPALVKEWMDLVLEHGWAYGSKGNALKGKKLLSVITTGGGESAYRNDGYNRYTMHELLRPIEQTAHLCGMEYLPPFFIHGTHQMDDETVNGFATQYRLLVTALRDDRIDWNKLTELQSFAGSVEAVITKEQDYAG